MCPRSKASYIISKLSIQCRLIFLKKLFYLKICPQYLVFPTFFSEIYIHYAGKLINTRGRSAALYLHQIISKGGLNLIGVETTGSDRFIKRHLAASVNSHILHFSYMRKTV